MITNNTKYKYVFIFILISIVISGCANNKSKFIEPTAEKGNIDLSGWDFESHGPLRLNGEWEFYWEQLYNPGTFKADKAGDTVHYIRLPGTWNKYLLNGRKQGSNGYGTFRLILQMPQKHGDMGIRIPCIHTAYRLWINDTLLVEYGQVGTAKEQTRPYKASKAAYFNNNESKLNIILQISNFLDLKGGPEEPIILGTEEQISTMHIFSIGFTLFFIGCLFIGSVYHFVLFFLRMKDFSTLFFALGTLLVCLRTSVVNDSVLSYFIPVISLEIINKIAYTGVYLGIPVFLCFVQSLFPRETSRLYVRGFVSLSIVFEIITLCFPTQVYEKAFFIYGALTILTLIYIFYIFIKALLKKRTGSIIILSGAIFLIVSIINDILVWNNIIHTSNLLHIGLFLLFFSQFFIIAFRFSKAFSENEHLNKNLENIVQERTNQLKEETVLKTNLLINLSHEIRTPITLILNYLNTYIEKTGITKEIKVVKNNIKKILRDVQHILNTEKYKKGQIVYNHDQICNLSKILAEKLLLFKTVSIKKHIELREAIAPDCYIKADPISIDQLINNLIENAIKFTPENGTINVTLTIELKEIVLVVKDTGIGIHKTKIDHLFDPYYQVQHEKYNREGIGLGLSIVKQIVDSLNGEIKVESEKDTGSTFFIRLKKCEIKKSDMMQDVSFISDVCDAEYTAPLEDSPVISQRFNVFIIEDSMELLHFYKIKMEDIFNLFFAANGKDALHKLTYIPKPDIILCDIMMDEMDGFEFYRKIREIKGVKDIPVIFITAKVSRKEKLKGLSLGAVDFISKPFYIDEIIGKINSLLKNRKEQREINLKEIEAKLSEFLRRNPKEEDENIIISRNFYKYKLSKREKDIVIRILRGLMNKEIALELEISENTVKQHISNIYNKCKVQNRVELTNLMKKKG